MHFIPILSPSKHLKNIVFLRFSLLLAEPEFRILVRAFPSKLRKRLRYSANDELNIGTAITMQIKNRLPVTTANIIAEETSHVLRTWICHLVLVMLD